MAGEYERRRFLEWARKYAEKYGYDPKAIDAEAWYDSTLTASENQEILKGAYPPMKTEAQIVEDEGARNTAQYAKYANVEGSRRRAEEVQAARKPSFIDQVKGWQEKNIDEPARRRETEHYFKTQDKIRERQERLKVKQADQEERQLAKQERQLDREAYLESPKGRVIEGVKKAPGIIMGGIKGVRHEIGGNQPVFTDSGGIRDMLAPKMNYGGSGSPLMGNQGGGNSVILGLMTGRSGQSRHPKGHYVTVIDKGVARRVYTGQPQPGQSYAQPAPQQPQPGNSLLDRMTLGNPSLLNQPAGKPAFDYSLSGNNQMRERLSNRGKPASSRYGYSFATKKKMRYL